MQGPAALVKALRMKHRELWMCRRLPVGMRSNTPMDLTTTSIFTLGTLDQ